MPYIDKKFRKHFDVLINALFDEKDMTPGKINYIITKIIHKYLEVKGKNYTNLNECIGVFESAKLEFYRRVVGPYEDTAIEKNGDVEL